MPAMPPSANRFDGIDALRGLAMVWMTVYHFSFDLNHFGYIRQNFYDDPFWTWQRTCILSLFLFTAGVGQAVALHQGQGWPRFWRRWGQVAACALLVSAGSWWEFGDRFIYFGTLHGIAVMLILVRLLAPWMASLQGALRSVPWLLGGLLIALHLIAARGHPVLQNTLLTEILNGPAWNWIGWISRKPLTEDHVPLLPWLGVMLWGVAAGQAGLRAPGRALQAGAAGPQPRVVRGLARLGRWSLSYYMLHQPVLFALLSAFKWCAG